jgi:hypothetical protein
LKKYSIILSMLVFSASAAAYTRITAGDGQMPKWLSMPVSYWINDKGSPQISNGSDFAAIQASFRTWELVPSADIRFNYKGTTPVGGVGHDGMNVVSFTDTSTPLGSSTIAATFSFFKREITDKGIELLFDESDIIFNPALDFSTSGEDNKFDIQSVLTHEIGHMLGLDHSALVSSVMVPFAAPSQLDQRTLAYDDIAAITEIYPKAGALPPSGQIQGVIRSGTAVVFGANVVAVDSEGTALVSTLSQPDGSYSLRFLPPGSYRVFAEPLDLPVTRDNIGGGSAGFYSNIRTDFGTTYFPNVSNQAQARTVTVAAGGSAIADIQTLPKSPTGLNLTRPGFAARIPRGSRGTLRIGGEDITDGVTFSASSMGLVLGTPSGPCSSSVTTNCFGGRISSVASTSATMDLSIVSATTLGPKNLAVNRGGDSSIVAGALVITEVGPRSIGVAPASGPIDGGSLVTITGSNFRSGAQVYFTGLPATGVRVVDSGTILATTPANSPGASNVVVMNSDGTWGVAPQGFSYTAEPPTVARVTPSSGPPTTTVVIEGDHFDTRAQNIAVQFNGVSGRVVSSTLNTITTIVPFGAASGPITVSVFGRAVTGPAFTVTAAAATTNMAGTVFNFIDASAASGGASLGFSNNDDAIAFATLPFNFSLFRDIYLAGSRVSVATNGFLSLETLSVAEFQNGSLPGQTVTRPGGSTGSIPPSMIAAFWDDLVLKSNSAVTTRTVGNAPNRQFVVEWANMGILDEDGKDLNATLTFEAILFEGSNDIQFVYRSLSGPRSDGSSATVGAQDLKRVTGIQSGFNKAILSTGYFTTYRFGNGSYVEAIPDLTPPTKPVVTDEGALTPNRTQLAASWTSNDPESGIREFQYAIGTTPGGTDLKPFTSTTQNSIVVTGLNLQLNTTYYFAVKAANGVGLVSEVGVSDGIRLDPAFQPQVKIIPSSPESASEFSGLAFLAPAAMTVVLRAYDSSGNLISGAGVRNPSTISLSAGQQYARLLPELFSIQNFDGWIEAQASGAGLGIFTATGAWDMSTLDGSVAAEPSADFVMFHAGASAFLVNPSSRTANVTITTFGTTSTQSLTIPARSRVVTTLPGVVRVQSSEALAAVERTSSPGKLAINAAVPVADAQSTLVFPHAVIGRGYTSTLIVANTGASQNLTITCGTSTATVRLDPNTTTRLSIAILLQESTDLLRVCAVTVTASSPFGSGRTLVGVLDIENQTDPVTMGARPAATDFLFPHVANGNGLFTGLALATGSNAARITIEIYDPSGGTPKSATITLAANQQFGKLVSELVAGTATQMGGYIRIRSDQPIWAWEIYGSGLVMASGPPL